MSDGDNEITRRGFMKEAGTTTLAAVGVEAVLAHYAEEADAAESNWQLSSDKKIRIGVVGGGFGCAFHWHEHPNCIVEAVSDLREDRRKRLMRVYKCEKSYESLEKLILDKNIDAVAVFTGAPDHVRHCVMAMGAGKHCISACPAAMIVEECHQLVETKQKTGLKYMMAETSCYRWPTILARRLYQDGAFGTLVYTEGEYYHGYTGQTIPKRKFVPKDRRHWRYGFPPMHYPTHSTAFLVGVTHERLTHVSCLGWGSPECPVLKGRDNPYGNPFSNNMALFHTSNGNMFRCGVFWRVYAHGERAQWLGTHMSMYMPGSGGQPFSIKAPGTQKIRQLPDFWHMVPPAMRRDSGHGRSHPFLTHEFVMALVEDREPAIDVYESLAMTAPGIVAHQSALKNGEQLPVPNFDRA